VPCLRGSYFPLPLQRDARHHQPDLLHGRLVALHDADDAPLVNHSNPVGQAADFIQVFRNQQNGRADLALLQQPLVDVLGGADIHPARRLGRDQNPRPARQLARHDQFLNIAPRKVLDRRLQAGRLDRELLHQLVGVFVPAWQVQEDAVGVGRGGVFVQEDVLLH
jgi:hypothetical protein